MIRQSSVIQERNAFVENLSFVVERFDFWKPFLYLYVVALYHLTPEDAPVFKINFVTLNLVPIILGNVFSVKLSDKTEMHICHFFVIMTRTNLSIDRKHIIIIGTYLQNQRKNFRILLLYRFPCFISKDITSLTSLSCNHLSR